MDTNKKGLSLEQGKLCTDIRTGLCRGPTSAGRGSCGVALEEVGVPAGEVRVLLQTAVELHVQAVLVLLLYRPTLPVLGPFLSSFYTRWTEH